MEYNNEIDRDYDVYTKNVNNTEGIKIQNVENLTYKNEKEELLKNYIEKNLPGEKSGIPPYAQVIKEIIPRMSGECIVVNYYKGRFIGKGGFAKCYEFTNLETKHKSAVKIVEKSSLTKLRSKQKLISEIKIHKSLHNSHIVDFEHYFEDADNVYILLEICHNQSLNELIKRRKRLTEFESVYYIHQLIHALKYLHSHRIIHRDLKLGNLFLSEKMSLKVGDFGLAAKLEYEGERRRTVCGTPNYIAPEILEGKSGHSYEVDIWAVGVILYTLLIGKPPFETNDVKFTYKKIKMNDYIFPEGIVISDAAKNLIKSILITDPYRRPSLEQILASDFLTLGSNLPKNLPSSTLAVPPTITYIRQFWPTADSRGIVPIPYFKINENIASIRSSESKENNIKQEVNTANNLCYIKNNASDVIIEKWIDYSSKYGVGYILSNQSVGVYFNDSTKIILDQKGNVFHYLERRSSDKIEIMSTYSVDDYPKDMLFKKVTLLNHFKNYLLEKEAEDLQKEIKNPTFSPGILNSDINMTKNLNPNKDKEYPSHQSNNFVYLKKWMRTKQAILFRLSNKIVQVIFLDHTQIILSSETKMVTFVNKTGEKEIFALGNALESDNTDMVKRLKYTKDILTHMLNMNRPSEWEKARGKENAIVKEENTNLNVKESILPKETINATLISQNKENKENLNCNIINK